MEEKYKQLLGDIDDGCVVIEEGKIAFANKSFSEIFGYKLEKMQGMPIARLIVPSGRQAAIELYEKVLRGEIEAPKRREELGIKEDGTPIIIESSTKVVLHENKQAALVVVHDITDRKQSEEKYRRLLEDMNDGYAVIQNEKIVFANRRFARIFGYEMEQVLGKPVDEFAAPESRQLMISQYEKAMRGEEEISKMYEMVVMRGDGKRIVIEANGNLIDYEGKSALHIILRDITDRKQVEEKYKELLEDMSDGYGVVQDGIFVFANQRFAEIYGYGPGQVLGMSFADFALPERREAAMVIYEKIMSGKIPPTERREVKGLRADGSTIVAESSSKFIQYDGKPALSIIVRDITDRKQTEEKYRDLLEDMSDGYGVVQDGIFVFANRRFAEIYGYEPDQILGMHLADFAPSDKRDVMMVLYEKIMSGEIPPPERREGEGVKADGTTIIAETSSKFIQYDGKPALSLIVRDITDRKQIEEKHKQLLDEMNDGYMVVDQGKIVFANRSLEEIYGYEPGQMLGKTLAELSAPEIRDIAMELYEKIISGEVEPPDKYEIISVKADGTNITVEASNKFIDFEGRCAISLIVRDITERKEMEEEIQRNYYTQSTLNEILKVSLEDIPLEEILKRALELILVIPNLALKAKGAIFLVEDDSETLIMKAHSNLNESVQETCNQIPFGKCLCGKTAMTREIQFADCIDNQHEITYENIEPHGHYVIPLVSAKKILGVMTLQTKEGHIRSNREEEIINSVANVLIGIIERKQAEEILRESEEKLSLIFESVPEGIVIYTPNGKILDLNEGLIHMHGYDNKSELIGRNVLDLISNRDHSRALEDMRTTVESGIMVFNYYTSVRKDRDEFPAGWSAVVLRDATGKPTGFLAVAMDATEPQKMQERLLMTDRLASLGKMVAGVAHELNNPLHGILGLSHLMKERDLPSDIREDITLINKETERAVSIVRNLLSFAQKRETVRKSAQINSVVESVLEIRAYEQKSSNIQVNANLASDLPEISADASQLQQVFLNIIINAEHFMYESHKQGILTITTEKVGNTIRVSISDDGPGISAENLKNIFNPFFTTKDIGKGTGLGLSISHGIISEHGGQIYAKSELGKGATFVIELPIKAHGTDSKRDQ